ncbi:MAG: extracellular solute-binding protein [Bacteroidales bacterium]
MIRTILLLLIILMSACNAGKKSEHKSGTITIFHAGSLAYPFREIIKEFNTEYPDIEVLTESSGSIAGARKITDLNRICDIYATADYKVIEELLYPEHASWYIAYARSELSVVYSDKSIYSDRINAGNWFEILQQPEVRFGRSDPNSDPCGYRTLLMWQLAEEYYNIEGFYQRMLEKDTRFIRPKEVDLLALLETNTIDYIFLYRSVAEQHGLKYVILPDSINLGNPELGTHYKHVNVELRGASPSEKIVMYGEPMIYAVTIPSAAPNPEIAETFLAFLLNPEKGLEIMKKNGQPPVQPLKIDNLPEIPENLKVLISKASENINN